MIGLDDDLVQRVDQLRSCPWTGTTYRYTTARRDPLSGAGARLMGGRWNPPDIFAVVYLDAPLAACLGELGRLAASQGTEPEEMLRVPYKLHTIQAQDVQVLDLRSAAAQAHVGLAPEDISDVDRTACQAVGHAAWFLGLGGLLAPSASGTGHVLAAFENRVAGAMNVVDSADLTPERYREFVAAP